METNIRIDAWLPPEMAEHAEDIGVKKASLDWANMLALGILAGAFIALGAVFATVAMASPLPYAANRLLGGLTFCLGLILVVVGGAELFTGNNLIAMAWANGKVSTAKLLRSWVIVYIGNFIGAAATAAIVFLGKQYTFGAGAVGKTALVIAQTKCSLGFVQAVALGILCNALVCMAVWLCYSARTTTDKIFSILFPISAFVACGFEHSVANMYFLPAGFLIKTCARPEYWNLIHDSVLSYGAITAMGMLRNLAAVTLGNIIGGSVMVGLVYWFVYLRRSNQPNSAT
ncbi:MAG TPA: formate/nitrite transporter family protein [Candidatus Acidoferrales bacterium]|nr:formate/nitrite transporter family protein [Candidatus Acidoferrales bacterium]